MYIFQLCCSSHLGRCVVHHLLGGEVTLVAHEKLVNIFTSVAVNLLQPLLHIVVRFLNHGNKKTRVRSNTAKGLALLTKKNQHLINYTSSLSQLLEHSV